MRLQRNTNQTTPQKKEKTKERTRSIDGCLFHNTHKLIQINCSITILIKLINHRLQLLITQLLTQLACYSAQVAYTDCARLVVVEQSEGFLDLVVGIALGQLRALDSRGIRRGWRLGLVRGRDEVVSGCVCLCVMLCAHLCCHDVDEVGVRDKAGLIPDTAHHTPHVPHHDVSQHRLGNARQRLEDKKHVRRTLRSVLATDLSYSFISLSTSAFLTSNPIAFMLTLS